MRHVNTPALHAAAAMSVATRKSNPWVRALGLCCRALLLVGFLLIGLWVSGAHAGSGIVLIGHEQGDAVLQKVAAQERSDIRRLGDMYEVTVESVGVRLSSLAPGAGITALANLLHANEIALIVVDSQRGPTPAIREHILVARQARVPMLAVLLVNVKALYAGAPDDAAELLALESDEIRDLLSTYHLNADAVPVFYDAQTPEAGVGVAAYGLRETLQALSILTPRRVASTEMQSVDKIWSAVYLLTEAEADERAVILTPDDSIVVWSEGTQSPAKLASLTEYHPGDYREMPLSVEMPLKAREGSRILLLRDDRVVGLGAITQIGH